MKFVLFTAVLIFTALAGASGVRVGNGGHGVVCEESVGDSMPPELLDLYEASHLYGRVPQTIFVSSLDEAVRFYRDQVQNYLPPGHPFLKLFDQAALLQLNIVSSDEFLILTDDLRWETAAPLGRDCYVVQIAVRGEPPFERSLEVSREFWSKSSYQAQALLLLHEVFHDWFWRPGEKIMAATALRQLIGILYTTTPFSERDQVLVRSLIETRKPLPSKDIQTVR